MRWKLRLRHSTQWVSVMSYKMKLFCPKQSGLFIIYVVTLYNYSFSRFLESLVFGTFESGVRSTCTYGISSPQFIQPPRSVAAAPGSFFLLCPREPGKFIPPLLTLRSSKGAELPNPNCLRRVADRDHNLCVPHPKS